jgi:PhzF family phenazine biosynthesis protein
MAPTQLSFMTVDVFTTTPYKGNPLAIVKVPGGTLLNQSQKQRIAKEFNFSETVFLHEQTDEDRQNHSAKIDIFTTTAEIPFAGHPTVGSANYLLRLIQNKNSNSITSLNLKAGKFAIQKTPTNDGVTISVAHNVHIHSSPFKDRPFGKQPVVSIVKGMTFILTALPDLEALGKQNKGHLDLDEAYTVHDQLDEDWREGLVASAFYVDLGVSDRGARKLRTRVHAWREDPATGSAMSALTSYLSLRSGRGGRYRYDIVQGVEMGRESDIFVEVAVKDSRDGVEIGEVLLSGNAVQVMEGTLNVPEDK